MITCIIFDFRHQNWIMMVQSYCRQRPSHCWRSIWGLNHDHQRTSTDDLAHSGVRPSVGSAELKSRHFPSNSFWKYLHFVIQIAQNDIVALQGLMCINVPWVDYIIPIQYRNMVYHIPYSVKLPHGSEQMLNSPKKLAFGTLSCLWEQRHSLF